jgi:hypothetical protein
MDAAAEGEELDIYKNAAKNGDKEKQAWSINGHACCERLFNQIKQIGVMSTDQSSGPILTIKRHSTIRLDAAKGLAPE